MAAPFASLLPQSDRGRAFALAGAMLALAALKLWLVAWHQIAAEGAARYDELLFVELADHIRQGQWLGEYDERTLVKGAVYPLWLAAVSLLSLPLLPAQHLLRIVAAAVLVMALRPLLPHRGARLALFAALVFDPATLDRSAMRVIREGVYPAWTMLVFAGLAALAGNPDWKFSRVAATGLGLGAALTLFWLTREEGVWLVPAAVLALGYAAWQSARVPDARLRRARAAAILVLPVAVVLLCIAAIAALNRHHYGVACVNELKAPFFEQAYGALTRVTAPYRPITPVTAAAREKIYAVSPAFAELRPHLDPPGASPDPARPSGPHEYFGGMFVWRFRDAAAMQGHARSLPDARAYYLRLAAQVNAACADGRLECGPERASLSPAWRNRYALPLAHTLGKCLHILLSLNWVKVDQLASIGPEETFPLYARVTNMRIAPIISMELPPVIRPEILRAIHGVYGVALYPLSILALFGFTIAGTGEARRRALSPLLVIAAAAGIAIATRTVLLSYINVSSFPAIYGIYSHPTYPLLYTFIALGIALGVRTLKAQQARAPRR